MFQYTQIPKRPEEFAEALSRLSEKEQYVVKGFILGMTEASKMPQEREEKEPA